MIAILNRQVTDGLNEKVSKYQKEVREQAMKLYKWKSLPGEEKSKCKSPEVVCAENVLTARIGIWCTRMIVED